MYLPMVFIREAEQSAWYTSLLQDVEKRQTLRDGKPIIQITMDNELWGSELFNVLWSGWIPATIVVSVVPERAIELRKS